MPKPLSLNQVPHIESIQDMIVQSAKMFSNRLALSDLNPSPISQVTFEELFEKILRFGSALREAGVEERSHVAILSENRVQWTIAYLTCHCFNYVSVPIDKNLSTNEILNILHESESDAIIFSQAFQPILNEIRATLKNLHTFINMDSMIRAEDETLSMHEMITSAKQTNPIELPRVDPHACATIVFTSGSLGRAKGVELTQHNIASNLMDMVSMMLITPEDRFLSVLPIHHLYECTCGQLCPLYCGASVYYARSLKTVADDLQQMRATVLLGVPLLYDKMFKRIHTAIKEDKVKSKIVPPLVTVTNVLSKIGWKGAKKKVFAEIHNKFGGSVRIFIAGGAAPDPLVAKGLREFGFNFIQGYGLTETSPILALNRLDAFKDDAAGIPLPHVEIKINEPDADGVGEIWARGPNVMRGYYKNEKATRETFSDDWFKTGDLGYLDQDGFLHISGRKKNVIISASGKNVFPEEIEDILTRSPFVLECCVYGEKDPKQIEIIAAQIVADAQAFIELAETRGVQITEELIRSVISNEVDAVNNQLKPYKQIKKFYLRDHEFQKTTTQKIKRHLVERE